MRRNQKMKRRVKKRAGKKKKIEIDDEKPTYAMQIKKKFSANP